MDISAYLKPLLRWWWLLVVSALLAGGSGYLVASRQPTVYQARTTLMVGHAVQSLNPTSNDLALSRELARTYAGFADRQMVRERTQEALGLSSLPQYWAQPIPNSQLLEIIVQDTDPDRAQAVANELGNQLITMSPSGMSEDEQARQAFVQEQLDSLERQILETEAEIQERQAELGGLVSATEIEQVQSDLRALQQKRNTLQSNYAMLLSNTREEAVNTLQIVEPAERPTRPIGGGVLKVVGAAMAVAIALAVATAYLLEYLDDTVKTPDSIEKGFDLPTVAKIGRFEEGETQGRPLALENPRSPYVEAFRGLRIEVRFSAGTNRSRTLLVSSPRQGEGKSLVAANLAAVMAQAGERVLLIDCDMRRPHLHKSFGADNSHGLGDLLVALLLEEKSVETVTDELEEGQHLHSPVSGLSLLPSGPIPPNPAELLGTQGMAALLNWFAEKFDYVLLDTPPVLSVTDAVVLSTQVDAVFLVARAGQTERADLKQAIDRLRAVNGPVRGVILNGVSPRSEYYDNYTYYSEMLEAEGKNAFPEPPAVGKSNGFWNKWFAKSLPRTLRRKMMGE